MITSPCHGPPPPCCLRSALVNHGAWLVPMDPGSGHAPVPDWPPWPQAPVGTHRPSLHDDPPMALDSRHSLIEPSVGLAPVGSGPGPPQCAQASGPLLWACFSNPRYQAYLHGLRCKAF